jgi:hypothetical protein
MATDFNNVTDEGPVSIKSIAKLYETKKVLFFILLLLAFVFVLFLLLSFLFLSVFVRLCSSSSAFLFFSRGFRCLFQ